MAQRADLPVARGRCGGRGHLGRCQARELTGLACEWRESADEEVPEITEESFAQRMELRSIAMDASRLPASQSSGSRASRFLRISGAGQY